MIHYRNRTMKKMILMVVAAMMVTMNVNAQNDDLKHEVGLYYGFGSVSNVVSTFAAAFSISTGDQTGFWGPVGIEYFYHASPVIGIGAVASIAGCKLDGPYGSNASLSETYYTFMPAVKFNWLRKERFGMYSGLAAGLMFINPSASGTDSNGKEVECNSEGFFMFQLSAIGVEFGGNIRGFAELGFGEKGVICAGLRYKF